MLLAVGTLLISSFCFTWLTLERQGTYSLVPTLQLRISLLPCFHTWSLALRTENDKLKMGRKTIIHNCLGKGLKIKFIIFVEYGAKIWYVGSSRTRDYWVLKANPKSIHLTKLIKYKPEPTAQALVKVDMLPPQRAGSTTLWFYNVWPLVQF